MRVRTGRDVPEVDTQWVKACRRAAARGRVVKHIYAYPEAHDAPQVDGRLRHYRAFENSL